jgi:hypothetical protein
MHIVASEGFQRNAIFRLDLLEMCLGAAQRVMQTGGFFLSATYSRIRMSELQRVAQNGGGANPPQVDVSTLPAAKRSNVV